MDEIKIGDLNRLILIVDDHKPIHDDFYEILQKKQDSNVELDDLETEFFGDSDKPKVILPVYEMDSAFQGKEAFQKVKEAREKGNPYAVGFVDVRMPPGWNGIETIKRIWEVDPDIQIVICTAYSDYSWDEIYGEFGHTDSLVFMRKPFDHTEVRQLASALTEKWNFAKKARLNMEQLEQLVGQRTEELNATLGERNKAIKELQSALDRIKVLSGLVPICANCKKIRDDKGYWNQIEEYIIAHSDAEFSHGICPECIKELYPDIYERMQAKKGE